MNFVFTCFCVLFRICFQFIFLSGLNMIYYNSMLLNGPQISVCIPWLLCSQVSLILFVYPLSLIISVFDVCCCDKCQLSGSHDTSTHLTPHMCTLLVNITQHHHGILPVQHCKLCYVIVLSIVYSLPQFYNCQLSFSTITCKLSAV